MVYDDNKLFQGNRVRKHDCDSFGAFDSPNIEPLAKLKAVIRDELLPGSIGYVQLSMPLIQQTP